MDVFEAVRRCDAIANRLFSDTRLAIKAHAIMEVANDLVPTYLGDRIFEAANTFNAVQQALSLKVAMDVGRIFDFSANERYPLEEQDKASIPVIRALLSRADLRSEIIERASNWPEIQDSDQRIACEKAINDFIETTKPLFIDKTPENQALKSLREMRNNHLAHALFDNKNDVSLTFNDIRLLMQIAIDAVPLVMISVQGMDVNLKDIQENDRKAAEHYFHCLAAGIQQREAKGEV